ncbi:MAG: hypothetical protein QM784_12470 [Polyangiaceae bacterium]
MSTPIRADNTKMPPSVTNNMIVRNVQLLVLSPPSVPASIECISAFQVTTPNESDSSPSFGTTSNTKIANAVTSTRIIVTIASNRICASTPRDIRLSKR